MYDAIQNIRVNKKYGLNDEYNREDNNVDFLSEYLSNPSMHRIYWQLDCQKLVDKKNQ